MLHVRIVLYCAENFQSMHTGHQQVQKDQGKVCRVLPDQGKRSFSVRRGYCIVFFLQDQLQYFPVYQFVVNDQDKMPVGGCVRIHFDSCHRKKPPLLQSQFLHKSQRIANFSSTRVI